MKKLLFIVNILIIISCNSGLEIYNDNLITDNESAKYRYYYALLKWKQCGVNNYLLRVKYGVFSPLGGIWEVEVSGGVVSQWLFNNKKNAEEYRIAAQNMTMDSLFKIAEKSFTNEKDSMFLFFADYDSEKGYVKITGMIPNPIFSEEVPNNKVFKYEVLEFRILE